VDQIQKFAWETFRAFAVCLVGLFTLAAVAGLLSMAFESYSRHPRLSNEWSVFAQEAPGKGLNYRDPVAQKELREHGRER
jgi:hypothetical protein